MAWIATLAVVMGTVSAQAQTSEPVGTTSGTLTTTVTITTAGTSASTTAAALPVLTQGNAGLDFNLASGGTCAASTSYTVGETCTVKYTFTPMHPWVRYGGIEVVTDAGTVLGNSFVQGTGNGPQAAFSLSTPTTPVTLGGGFHQPTGLVLDASGNIFVADLNNNTVYEILAAGGYTTIKTLGGGFDGPSTVAVDGSGNIYIANANDRTVSEMPPGCTNAACVVTLGGGFTRPAGIAVDGIGNVYVSDEGDGVVSEMPPGCASSSCVTTIGGGFRQGIGLAVDGIGNVYVADIAATVARIPPGCLSSSCVTTLGGGFVQPYGVAVDAGGNVYVADHSSHQVTVMPADCASAGCVVPLGGGFTSPNGIEVDGSGNVYVADPGNVTEMPPGCFSAACVTKLSSSFAAPFGLAVDGSGNVFVSDAGNAKAYEIDLQDPPNLSFAGSPLGTPSAPQLVTVGNNGNLPLTISALTLTNASLGTATTCATSSAVASGAACGLDIEFTPATLGSPLTGSVSINDNDLFNPSATQIVPLTGSGTQQTPTLTLASVATVGYGGNSLLRVWLMWTGAGVAPTGAVTFSVDNGTALKASCTGTASPIPCIYSGSFAVGLHSLNASYAGDTNYAGAASAPESFTISAATLTIKANNASRLYGAANPAFTGSVSGAQPGDSFVESFTTPATTLSPVAAYAIVPSATGANVSAYTETIVNGTLTIAQAPTSIAFSASSPSLSSGQTLTFTAQVSPSTSGTPTGIVTVLDNGGPLTTLTLNGGLATYTSTALSPGITHVLTATYGGDSNFLGTTASGTPAGTVTVTAGGTDTAITSTSGTSFTLIPGGALSFDLLLTPQPGAYPGPVTFTISGLPPGATPTFTPPGLSAVTSPTTVHVTIETVASTAKLIRMHGDIGAVALSLLLIPIGCSQRTRKRLSKLSFLAILLGGVLSSMVITGCGSNGFFRQESQNYTLIITATSGSVKHVATITLNIQ